VLGRGRDCQPVPWPAVAYGDRSLTSRSSAPPRGASTSPRAGAEVPVARGTWPARPESTSCLARTSEGVDHALDQIQKVTAPVRQAVLRVPARSARSLDAEDMSRWPCVCRVYARLSAAEVLSEGPGSVSSGSHRGALRLAATSSARTGRHASRELRSLGEGLPAVGLAAWALKASGGWL
jgi:hypothetical protein